MAKNSHLYILLLILCILLFCMPGNGVHAFGAGNIPSFAYMEGRAFRHGDIEDTLAELARQIGGLSLGTLMGKGPKFGGLDIKRVYFGNWLRDYSQAVDVAGLQKLELQTIINLCMALGFLAHGYATHEFEVTQERLGVYLPIEHIDNPKGYPEDARTFDSRLRGPVDPRELEIDPRTGMKNYIANENGSWQTSKGLVRHTLERCIHLGRMHRSQGRKEDLYEAYRLLGQALHTLEDFAAHSNFCELALVSLGFHDVFTHVGDQVRVQSSQGSWVAPLITGTFGSSDFIHSLLGEATDHISQASVTDLNSELKKARAKSDATARGGPSPSSALRELFFNLPGGDGQQMSREMESIERIRAGPNQPGGKRPEDMNPQELHAVLWQVLTFRDSVVKKIEKTIEKIPGLGPLIEKLMDSISVFVFTTLEPFLVPIMKQATAGLMAASGEVINSHDQYEVFNDPRASDPTHSFLSKDHFNLILNEPAGNLGKIVLRYTVTLVVKAWDDSSMNVNTITEDILQCMFHPEFHNRNSVIQRQMMEYMGKWIHGLGSKQHEVLRRLTKDSVRNHQNIRLAGEGGSASSNEYSFAENAGHQAQNDLQGYLSQVPIVGSATGFLGKLDSGTGQGMPQAQSLINQFTPGGGGKHGGRRDEGPRRSISPGGYPGEGYGPGVSGESSSYFSNTPPPTSFPRPDSSSYPSPPGAPPSAPSFPSPGGFGGPPPPSHEGYHPSYEQPSPFPQPSYGGGGYGGDGYAPPPGPPPPGPPGFPRPDADSYPPPPGAPPGQGYGNQAYGNQGYW
ncbi:heterokaryon incompatibility protein Het-C-domain-containing protein [Abortiporus biennis]|nr:heterokaryon incompatibility protein Het-C-domain-containing protein [Abortiporus biennis]